MRSMFALSAVCLTFSLGGCPDADPALLDAIDDVVDALPDDLFDTSDPTSNPESLPGDSDDPLTLSDLFDRFDERNDDDPALPPIDDPCTPTDFGGPDDGPSNPPPPGVDANVDNNNPPPPGPGNNDDDDGNPPPPPGGNDDPPPPNGSPDGGDDGGDAEDGGDDGDPAPPAALVGGYSGTITCLSWQAVVAQDPNLFELPDEPAVGSLAVDLSFDAGAPDGLWIPGFIDGPDAFAEVSTAGETFEIDDTYQTWTVKIRGEVLEASYDGTTARTVADVTFRFRDAFGNLLIRAKGEVTQEVIAQPDGSALYRNDIEYEATMWNPSHTISFDVVEIYDCDGTLD